MVNIAIPAATLSVYVAVKGMPQGSAKIRKFDGELKEVSGRDATATLKADLQRDGFEAFGAEMAEARVKAARPIVAKATVTYDKSAFSGLRREMSLLNSAMRDEGGIGGGKGGLGSALASAATPLGRLGTLAAVASPQLISVAGAAAAVGGSAAEAALGVGALAVGGYGTASVGIAGIAGVAIPAVISLKSLTKAQTAYTQAVNTYGVQSSQAESAARKLRAAERSSGHEAVALVRSLDSVKERWVSLTKPGRENFLGGLGDGLAVAEHKLPMLAKSADRSTAAMRHSFDGFLHDVTGKGSGFGSFIHHMTGDFVKEAPLVSHALADWVKIFEHIAVAAGPELIVVTRDFDHWSNSLLASSGHSRNLRQDIHGLVDQTMSWVHLLTASSNLLIAVFGAGAHEGQRAVDDLTGKMKEWTGWVESHHSEVDHFFTESVNGARDLTTILGHGIETWFLMSQAMEPVEAGAIEILKDLSQLKVGGVSALTVLLSAFVALKVGIAAVKIRDLYDGFKFLRAITQSTVATTEAETAALSSQAEAAGAAAAANADLAASQRLLIANSSGTVVGESAIGAELRSTSAAGPSMLGRLGRAAGYAGAGFIGGQVAGSVVGGRAGGILSAAGTGAGIGAGIGTFFPEFGGPVTGAALGGGIGAAVQGISDLLHHERQLSPLQKALSAESKHAADAMRNQRDAAHGLASAEQRVIQTSQRHHAATKAVARAHKELNTAVRKFGPDSVQAHEAEVKLANAQHRDAVTAHEVKDAYKLTANERRRDRLAIRETVAANKQLIPNLKTVVDHLREQSNAHRHNQPLLNRTIEKERQLNTAVAELGRAYAQAEKVGPRKWVRALESMDHMQSESGIRLHGLIKQLPEFGQKTQHTASVGGKAWLDYRGTVHTSTANVTGDVKSMTQASTIQITGLDKKALEVLRGLGVSKVSFSGGRGGKAQHRQDGGFIVPGTGSGDSFHATLKPNSFVLNREATAAHGFQRGGVPVVLEPGERVFGPQEVQRVGGGNLAAMNASVPRFQKGGSLGPEPMLAGPAGALRSVGQAAIHEVYKGAQSSIAIHKPNTGLLSAGGGSVEAQIANVLFGKGFNKIGAAGVIGNSYGESTNDPSAEGTGGGGLFGFTAGAISLANLKAASGRAGVPWDNVAFQVGFMLRHGGLGLRGNLNAAKTPEEAAVIFMNDWERPGIPRQDVREAGARRAYQHGYQQGGVITGTHPGGKPPKWAGWTKDGRWNPRAAQHLITGGEALGIPTKIHPAPSTGSTNKATPTDAVHWAMRHLGDSDQWGYPGEWCGAFLGADMQAIGLTPPSGYPSAASWAGYGTNLGRGHVQAGAILDYGSAHVAMAISSSEQIQGNDIHASVGTSGIGGVIGGSSLTAVRWPPYGNGPGAGSAPAEKVPAVFHGARTKLLSLGTSTPNSLHGIQKEIHRREAEVKVYRRAAKAATGMPKTQQAIQANVTALETRLSQLRKAASKLRRKVAQKRFTARLGRSLGKVTGYEKLIEAKQREYQERSEFAEQVVGLEPTEPILPANATEAEREAAEKSYVASLAGYIGSNETPAYAAVLHSEADWRNTILFGQGVASHFEGGAEGHVHKLSEHIQSINDFTKKVADDEAAYRKAHSKGDFPQWILNEEKKRNELRAELPMLRYKEAGWRSVLGEARNEFYGGVPAGVVPVHPPMPPLAGTGAFEQSLIEVQGTHWPGMHEPLTTLPETRSKGSFGGAIWDTQTSIEELGLRIRQAQAGLGAAGSSSAGAGKSEREELLEGLLREANERKVIAGALEPTLAQYEASYPVGYMGAFEKGGVALVGERGRELAHLPSGTRVHSNADTERMLGGDGEVHVHVNGHINQEPGDARDPIEVLRKDPRFDRLVKEKIRTTRSGIATSGVGRAFRG